HRLYNLRHRGGRHVMTDDYFAQTTLYALGRVLAVERILGLEGVYPELAALDPELSEFLKMNRVDARLEDTALYKYDRMTVAEALIEREDGRSRASTYVEFRRRYEDPKLHEKPWLEPALQGLAALDGDVIDGLMECLEKIARRLEPHTQIPSSFEVPFRTR
ncbi:MAG TPA: hypothetical protein VD769_12715, partial [Gaiellaceae bacterium]|nr:hypothetical protein [Gaiellaceae bacterium]